MDALISDVVYTCMKRYELKTEERTEESIHCHQHDILIFNIRGGIAI